MYTKCVYTHTRIQLNVTVTVLCNKIPTTEETKNFIKFEEGVTNEQQALLDKAVVKQQQYIKQYTYNNDINICYILTCI